MLISHTGVPFSFLEFLHGIHCRAFACWCPSTNLHRNVPRGYFGCLRCSLMCFPNMCMETLPFLPQRDTSVRLFICAKSPTKVWIIHAGHYSFSSQLLQEHFFFSMPLFKASYFFPSRTTSVRHVPKSLGQLVCFFLFIILKASSGITTFHQMNCQLHGHAWHNKEQSGSTECSSHLLFGMESRVMSGWGIFGPFHFVGAPWSKQCSPTVSMQILQLAQISSWKIMYSMNT